MRKILWLVALILWSALIAATVVKVLGGGHAVYPLFVEGGKAWLNGHSLYHGACLNFQYWPGFAAFMTLFAFFPFPVGDFLFSALEFALFGYALWQFAKIFLPPEKRVWLFLAIFPPAVEGFICQQSNPLLGAAVILGAAAAARRNWWRAAGWLMLPGVIKIGPCCFALLFAVVFLKQLGWRMAVLLVVFAGLPFLFQEPHYVAGCYREWLDMLVNEEAGQRWGYRDAWTLWEFITTGAVRSGIKIADMTVYRVFQLGAAVLAALFCLPWRAWGQKPGDSASAITRHARVIFPLIAAAWWLQLWGPSTEIATGTLFAIGPATALLVAWLSATASRPAAFGKWLMTAAYILICLGLSGDLEWHLKHAFPQQTWFQTFLPAGGLLLGLWLFTCGQSAIRTFGENLSNSIEEKES